MPRVALEPADYPFFDYRRFTFSLGVAAADNVWLSGSTAARFDAARGGIVVDGGLVAQSRVIYDKMRVTLAAGDLALSDIVRLVEYVTPAALAELPRLAALRREIFAGSAAVVSTLTPKAATGRTASSGGGMGSAMQVVMPRLVDPAASAQIELAAARTPAARVVFVAAESDPAAGDVVGQCREVYARIGRLLTAAGTGFDEVVKTTEFVTPAGLAAYRKTAEVRREVFAPPYPAATGVVCEGLVESGAQLAVEATAVVGSA